VSEEAVWDESNDRQTREGRCEQITEHKFECMNNTSHNTQSTTSSEAVDEWEKKMVDG